MISKCFQTYTQEQLRPKAFMHYQVTEGGLEPSAIARGLLVEFSRRARRVTSHLITRRGRLGTRMTQVNCMIAPTNRAP